jgi:hypothetical protein
MKIESHKDLKVWQESMNLVEDIYKITSTFPNHELFGLSSQLISVPQILLKEQEEKEMQNGFGFFTFH